MNPPNPLTQQAECGKITLEVSRAEWALLMRLRQLDKPYLVWLEVACGIPREIVGKMPMQKERLG